MLDVTHQITATLRNAHKAAAPANQAVTLTERVYLVAALEITLTAANSAAVIAQATAAASLRAVDHVNIVDLVAVIQKTRLQKHEAELNFAINKFFRRKASSSYFT
ncbi:MAG: hypothetical protein S4CHLAM7_10260 [Chlamydiae bacterium]|nr:hypothetical protein [Chlamydiota bacterium]